MFYSSSIVSKLNIHHFEQREYFVQGNNVLCQIAVILFVHSHTKFLHMLLFFKNPQDENVIVRVILLWIVMIKYRRCNWKVSRTGVWFYNLCKSFIPWNDGSCTLDSASIINREKFSNGRPTIMPWTRASACVDKVWTCVGWNFNGNRSEKQFNTGYTGVLFTYPFVNTILFHSTSGKFQIATRHNSSDLFVPLWLNSIVDWKI